MLDEPCARDRSPLGNLYMYEINTPISKSKHTVIQLCTAFLHIFPRAQKIYLYIRTYIARLVEIQSREINERVCMTICAGGEGGRRAKGWR